MLHYLCRWHFNQDPVRREQILIKRRHDEWRVTDMAAPTVDGSIETANATRWVQTHGREEAYFFTGQRPAPMDGTASEDRAYGVEVASMARITKLSSYSNGDHL